MNDPLCRHCGVVIAEIAFGPDKGRWIDNGGYWTGLDGHRHDPQTPEIEETSDV